MRENKPFEGGLRPALPYDRSSVEITDDKFKKFLNQAIEMVKTLALDGKSKGLTPTIFVHCREFREEDLMLGDIELVVIEMNCNFNDRIEKRNVMMEAGRKIYKEHLLPVAVFMASEAWMATVDPKKEPKDEGWSPSKDQDRKEVIVIGGRTMMGECKAGAFIHISRDKDGIMSQVGEVSIEFKMIESGLLMDFFSGYFENQIGKRT